MTETNKVYKNILNKPSGTVALNTRYDDIGTLQTALLQGKLSTYQLPLLTNNKIVAANIVNISPWWQRSQRNKEGSKSWDEKIVIGRGRIWIQKDKYATDANS